MARETIHAKRERLGLPPLLRRDCGGCGAGKGSVCQCANWRANGVKPLTERTLAEIERDSPALIEFWAARTPESLAAARRREAQGLSAWEA